MPTGTGAAQNPSQAGFGIPNSNTGQTGGMLTTDFYDNRRGIGTDAAAITLIPANVISTPNQVWDVTLAVEPYAGTTISAGTYIMGWTHNTATMTATVNIAAVTANAALGLVIFPDANTAVTVKLTTVTGTGSPLVSVAAIASRAL